jgi:hypothetical protein
MAEATESMTFLTALVALAERLAVDGIDILAMTYQSQLFGSWELEVSRRRLRILVTWEGKDRHLRISTAQLASGSTARAWQLAEEHDFRKLRPDAAQLFERARTAIAAHAGV